MTRLIFSLLTVLVFTSCHSQQTAKEKAIAEKKAIEEARPGTIPAAAGGWTMTAKINGKPWTASSLMPPQAAGRIIGYYKDAYIGLPYYYKMGAKSTFRDGNAVDLSVEGDDNFYGGRAGSMEITKVNGDWVEGTFHFTANSKQSTKTFEGTDGFFRLSTAGHP